MTNPPNPDETESKRDNLAAKTAKTAKNLRETLCLFWAQWRLFSHRLQWRLTLSYALFTTVTALMFGIIGVFMPVMKEFKEMVYQYDRDYFFDSSKFEKRFKFKPISPAEEVKLVVWDLKNKQ